MKISQDLVAYHVNHENLGYYSTDNVFLGAHGVLSYRRLNESHKIAIACCMTRHVLKSPPKNADLLEIKSEETSTSVLKFQPL